MRKMRVLVSQTMKMVKMVPRIAWVSENGEANGMERPAWEAVSQKCERGHDDESASVESEPLPVGPYGRFHLAKVIVEDVRVGAEFKSAEIVGAVLVAEMKCEGDRGHGGDQTGEGQCGGNGFLAATHGGGDAGDVGGAGHGQALRIGEVGEGSRPAWPSRRVEWRPIRP